jgi:hypothetical protein
MRSIRHRIRARELGLSRTTIGKYVTEMGRQYQQQRQEQADYDLEVLLATMDQSEAAAWSTKAAIERTIEEEQARRNVINQKRAVEGKPPLPRAAWASLRFWPKHFAELFHQIRKAEETRARVLGLISNRDRRDEDVAARRAELERLMNTTVHIVLETAPPPDPDWLSAEDQKALEVGKSEYSGVVVPPDPLAEDGMAVSTKRGRAMTRSSLPWTDRWSLQ